MNNPESLAQVRAKIIEQYDNLPYPHIPIEEKPTFDYNAFFVHDITTSHYLAQQKIIDRQDKIILDAGCGSGWKTQTIANANPGAKIVGVDISPKSIEIAKARFKYHGITNCEFHAISLDEISQLNYQFDYINCDEVIYLLPNPAEGLQILQSVLSKNGILRTNFHNYYQRFHLLNMQELFATVGLMEDNPDDFEVEIVKETFTNLKNNVSAKGFWQSGFAPFMNNAEKLKSSVLMNYLLQSDKGYTIPQVFTMLGDANLQFLSMTDWRSWNVRDLFQSKDNLPDAWEMGLENISLEEELHIYELLNPIHRLIDVWCVNGDASLPPQESVMTWSVDDWLSAHVTLHPQLRNDTVKNAFIEAVKNQQSCYLNRFISLTAQGNVEIESNMAGCLLSLWEGKQRFQDLAQRWQHIKPINLLTLAPVTSDEVCQDMIRTLTKLESFLYILVEK